MKACLASIFGHGGFGTRNKIYRIVIRNFRVTIRNFRLGIRNFRR